MSDSKGEPLAVLSRDELITVIDALDNYERHCKACGSSRQTKITTEDIEAVRPKIQQMMDFVTSAEKGECRGCRRWGAFVLEPYYEDDMEDGLCCLLSGRKNLDPHGAYPCFLR